MRILFQPARDVQDLALAFTETLTHLHYLAAAGRAKTEIAASGLRRFRWRLRCHPMACRQSSTSKMRYGSI